MSRKGGVLCSDASLPGSSLATGEVKDNFMGIPQEFAHTRLYADVDFTFYVDIDYTNLRIFEGWIDYISSGSESMDGMNELTDNYYRRMQYPENYKANTMYITKFEKDIDNNMGRRLDYLFVNAFPKMVNAIPVSYGGADILKVGVSFNYDRYIMNPRGPITRGDSGSFTDIDRSQASAELDACDVSNWMYATCRIGCGKLTVSVRKVIGPVRKVMPFTSQMAVFRPENCHLRGGRNWMHATCRIGCMRHVELGVGS